MPRTTKAHLEAVNESLASKLDAAEKELAEARFTLRLVRAQLNSILGVVINELGVGEEK